MEESITTPEAAPTTETTQEAQRTFTQEDVNRILANDKRKEREALTSLQTEIVTLREKAAKLDQYETEQMTAVEKANREREEALQRLNEYEQRAKAAEITAMRVKVGAELGLPAALAERLAGEDVESIKADAEAIVAALPKPTAQVPAVVNDTIDSDLNNQDPFLVGMKRGMGIT
jgi:TolA-binding protein